MPEKTHGRALRNRRGVGGLFKLLRRFVAQRRMEPPAIVVAVDENRDVFSQVIEVAVFVRINLLPLESLHEAFATGVVVRIRRPAHARNQFVLPQHCNVDAGCVLNAAVGMMHKAGRRLSFRDRLLQRCDPELAGEAKAIVALAFRNGPIEDVHAGKLCPTCSSAPEYSRITDDEIKAIMKSAVDRMYALLCLRKSDPDGYATQIAFGARYTTQWDEPEKTKTGRHISESAMTVQNEKTSGRF